MTARAVLIGFGVLIIAASLWSLWQPDAVISEYGHVVLGVLLFLAPFVFGYQSMYMNAAWTAWVGGVLTVALGAWAVPESNRMHKAVMGH